MVHLQLDALENDRHLVSPVAVHSSPEADEEAEQNNEDDDDDDRTILRGEK